MKNEPKYISLYKELEKNISTGKLLSGDKLPSKRAFAKAKHVSFNTVMTVYDLAVKNGLIRSVERVGYFVRSNEDMRGYSGMPWSVPDARKYVFSINANGISKISRKLEKAQRDAQYDIENRLLLSKEYTGNVLLRERICEYLYKTRRIVCTSEQIVPASGLNEIMSICARLLGSVYAFENPTEKKLVFSLTDNRKTVPIPAGEKGFDMNALRSCNADVFFCMPEKQYPIGYKLSMHDREALLYFWGDGKFIIECGLCCDFAFKENLPPLFSMSNSDNVIYINSFDKVTAPGLTLAYMVLPKSMVKIFQDRLWYHHSNISEYDSLVISEFIANGGIYGNIKRLRKIYEKKEGTALSLLNALPFHDRLRFAGVGNGCFFGLNVETSKTGGELMARNTQKDVKLLSVSCYKFIHDTSAPLFAFGYGGVCESDLAEGIRLIGEAWDGFL